MSDSGGLKIIEFRAENIKKLRAVTIKPTGEVVQITGRNGAGKTSVLDAIFWALAGTKPIQKAPIRKGQEHALVSVSLGDERVRLVVERNFTAGGSVLRVSSPEGARFPSPQSMLDSLLGELSFDPLAFAQAEPREQVEALRAIVPLDVDVDNLDGLNARDYDRRTETNREAKSKRAQAEGIRTTDEPLGSLVDISALKDRLTRASKTNVDIEARRGRREQAALDIATKRKSAAEKREEARRLSVAAAEFDAEADRLEEKLDAAPALADPVDVVALRAELDRSESANAAITAEAERRTRKEALVRETEDLERQSRELTSMMEARAQAKAEAIARAAMPVAGLGFGDGIVTFGGVPFDQASSAEQLRIGLAIAMAANPKLRVIRIKEGSLLDADNLALIAEMARERDYQVWIERVDTSGKVGILIEDGSIVAVDGEPVPAP